MNQLKALWKYLLSFRKSEWGLEDYPVRVKIQPPGPNIPKYHAQVVNWWVMGGLDETRDQALEDLKMQIRMFKEHQGCLPRPGTKVQIQYASMSAIEPYLPLLEEFLEKIFGFEPDDPVLITDESSLYDFEGINDDMDIEQKIRDVYGIEVSDIEGQNVARVLQRIEESRR